MRPLQEDSVVGAHLKFVDTQEHLHPAPILLSCSKECQVGCILLSTTVPTHSRAHTVSPLAGAQAEMQKDPRLRECSRL